MTVADFDPAERFVAGTVGPPGSRTFFLQARGRGHVVSVSLEKLQVSMLGERIGDLLDRVGEDGSVGRPDNDPLDTPIEDEFRVNAIGLGASVGFLSAIMGVGGGFTSGALVAAGRPPCPFCGQALDPSGHVCPRANGYRR